MQILAIRRNTLHFDNLFMQYEKSVLNEIRKTLREPISVLLDQTGFLYLDEKIKLNYCRDTDFGFNTTDKTFEDLCIERANQLKLLKKPITLLWSGGVDSTTALVALLLVECNLSIISTKDNLFIENKCFYEKLAKRQDITIYLVKDAIEMYSKINDLKKTNIIVSAETDIFWQDFKRNLPDISYLDYFKDLSNNQLQILENYIVNTNPKVHSILEFYWWNHLTCLHQQNLLKHFFYSYRKYDTCHYMDNFYDFFSTNDFRGWAKLHVDKKLLSMFRKPKHYKFYQKRFIYGYNKDYSYYLSKTKSASSDTSKLNEIVNSPCNYLVVTKDKQLIYKEITGYVEFTKYIQLLNSLFSEFKK